MAKRRENEMYEAVKAFFKKDHLCKHVYTDVPEQKRYIHLLRNLTKRKPDVVGITKDNEIYLAEGKMLSQGGQPFEQCVGQVLSLKAFGDHLYVFFPMEEWNELLKEDKDKNVRDLKKNEIGLLLVDESGGRKTLLSAPQNSDVDEAKKRALLKQLEIVKDELVPTVEFLSSKDAANAQEIIRQIQSAGKELAEDAIKRVFKKKRVKWRFSFWTDKDKDGETAVGVFLLGSHAGDLFIEFDPFGGYLRDGYPCLWIERNVTQATLIKRLSPTSSGFGTHVYFHHKGRTVPISDLTTKIEYNDGGFCLMHKVEFFNRNRDGLKREIEAVLLAGKKSK